MENKKNGKIKKKKMTKKNLQKYSKCLCSFLLGLYTMKKKTVPQEKAESNAKEQQQKKYGSDVFVIRSRESEPGERDKQVSADLNVILYIFCPTPCCYSEPRSSSSCHFGGNESGK